MRWSKAAAGGLFLLSGAFFLQEPTSAAGVLPNNPKEMTDALLGACFSRGRHHSRRAGLRRHSRNLRRDSPDTVLRIPGVLGNLFDRRAVQTSLGETECWMPSPSNGFQ